ncbi:MAG: M48 family metallopeptidase [Campylobacterales bacterium]|nr:M48 family metallopeptidase [Campylobacterales bacterium]
MFQMLIALFSLFTLVKIYISFAQMRYISKRRDMKPVLLEDSIYKEAADYAVAKEKLSMLSICIDYLLFLGWMFFGFRYLYVFLHPHFSEFFTSITFLFGYFTFEYIITLPISIYQAFRLDKRFGFSNTTPRLFILDQIKSVLMFIVLGFALFSILVWVIDSFALWWLYAFFIVMGIMLVINFLYPTIIAPLFNKFTPLEDIILKEKIETLMVQAGMKANGVFVMDASKRDGRLNAFFGGIGKSKRVVLFDTLLEKLEHSELIAVLGHELGHFRHGDIWKNILLMSLMMFLAFFILGNIPNVLFESLGIAPIAGAKIAMILILFPLISFIWMPIISFFSRGFEYRADVYGSSVGGKEELVSALLKLVSENKSFPLSHPLFVFFYYSHPPIVERLRKLGLEV